MKKVRPLGKKLLFTYLFTCITPAIIVAGVCYNIASRTQKRIIRQSLESFHNVVDQTMEQNKQSVILSGQALVASARVVRAVQARDVAFLKEYAAASLPGSTEIKMPGFPHPQGLALNHI